MSRKPLPSWTIEAGAAAAAASTPDLEPNKKIGDKFKYCITWRSCV